MTRVVSGDMTDLPARLRGSFVVQAQERIVFGEPAREAVSAEVARCRARRVFVVSTRSLVNADRQRALAEAMGAPGQEAAALVAALIATLDQPGALRAVGIERKDLDTIAEQALSYPPVHMNPRTIRGAADVREILELAW